MALGHAATSAGRSDWLAAGDAAESKIRDAAEAAEDVANVVCGRQALPKDGVPLGDNPLDDLDAGDEDVVNGDVETVLVDGG